MSVAAKTSMNNESPTPFLPDDVDRPTDCHHPVNGSTRPRQAGAVRRRRLGFIALLVEIDSRSLDSATVAIATILVSRGLHRRRTDISRDPRGVPRVASQLRSGRGPRTRTQSRNKLKIRGAFWRLKATEFAECGSEVCRLP